MKTTEHILMDEKYRYDFPYMKHAKEAALNGKQKAVLYNKSCDLLLNNTFAMGPDLVI
jgi:hypothetical protein